MTSIKDVIARTIAQKVDEEMLQSLKMPSMSPCCDALKEPAEETATEMSLRYSQYEKATQLKSLDIQPNSLVFVKMPPDASYDYMKQISDVFKQAMKQLGLDNPVIIGTALDPKLWDITQLMLYRRMIDETIEQLRLKIKEDQK